MYGEKPSEVYISSSRHYIVMPIYFKMRKLQIGKLWKTQFVKLHRDEVKKLQAYQKSLVSQRQENSVCSFISTLENQETVYK